jgi:Taurine catabolism dioxygenase TauD, TfdA family
MRFLTLAQSELPGATVLRHIGANGAVLFQDTTMVDIEEFLASWVDPYSHPHEDRPGITILEPRVNPQAGERGFTADALGLHTDRATAVVPPSILAMLVLSQSCTGGDCLLADFVALTKVMPISFLSDPTHSPILQARSGEKWPVIRTTTQQCWQIRYRDDEVASPMASSMGQARVIREIGRLIETTRPFPLEAGAGYLVHNHRYLHGRRAFGGRRRVPGS